MLLSPRLALSAVVSLLSQSHFFAHAITFRGWVCPKRYRREDDPSVLQGFTNMVDAENITQIQEELALFEENEGQWRDNLVEKRRQDFSFRGVSDCDTDLSPSEYLQHANLLAEYGFPLSGSFVNIGAKDGVEEDPLHAYIQAHNATGLMLEVDEKECENLRKNFGSSAKVTCEEVTPHNIVNLIQDAGDLLKPELDVIKLDIDSFDAPVLEEILHAGYRPKHFWIEVNPAIPPPFKFATQYHRQLVPAMIKAEMWHWPLRGMSVSYVVDLLAKFDYDFVTFGYHDAVFVHKQYRRAYNFRTPFDEYDCYHKSFIMSNGFPIRQTRRWFYEVDKYKGIEEISEYINKYVAKNTKKTFPFMIS